MTTPRPWTEGPRLAFDLETTGRNPLTARIVTASAVMVAPDGTKTAEHEWLLNPGVEIPEEAASVHGITTDQAVEHGEDPGPAVLDIFHVLEAASANGNPIIGHNLPYDLTVMAAELLRHGHDADVSALAPILDTLVIDKAANKYVRGSGQRKLVPTAARYGVELTEEQAHGSAADCYASERIATAIAARHPSTNVDAMKLHGWQVIWAARQARELQDYFDRIGKIDDDTGQPVVVDGTWPVRPVTTEDIG